MACGDKPSLASSTAPFAASRRWLFLEMAETCRQKQNSAIAKLQEDAALFEVRFRERRQ